MAKATALVKQTTADGYGSINVQYEETAEGSGIYVPSSGSVSISSAGVNGTPVAGSLNATTSGLPLSASSVPCKGVMVFNSEASADTYVGDSGSQPCRLPSLPVFIPADNVNKVYGKLSTGTGTIPWIAIT